MAWNEWEQIKADAVPQEPSPTRLNQVGPAAGGGGATGGADMASTPAAKKAAAKAINEVLEPGATRDGKHAAGSKHAAVKEFGPKDGYGWETSAALKRVHETWEKQVRMLLDRLAAEKQAPERDRHQLPGQRTRHHRATGPAVADPRRLTGRPAGLRGKPCRPTTKS
ncbi:hypothetical protein AB4225_04610 [Streptomyces sp. 2RAF24]|uniref:hypothetical protein n=1 Tax=Streptomyces sp. 2RAF24 TaxID=3232997 RepID=UPI003F9CC31B